jgi:hypothetical protein
MSLTVEIIKSWETSSAHFQLRGDRILLMQQKENTRVELAGAEENTISVIRNVGTTDKFPLIVELSPTSTYNHEARDHARHVENWVPISAVAIITSDRKKRLLATIYNVIRKPEVPYKVFETKAEALQWVKSFVHVEVK